MASIRRGYLECANYVRHKQCLISPRALRDAGIPFHRIVQRQNEFVVRDSGRLLLLLVCLVSQTHKYILYIYDLFLWAARARLLCVMVGAAGEAARVGLRRPSQVLLPSGGLLSVGADHSPLPPPPNTLFLSSSGCAAWCVPRRLQPGFQHCRVGQLCHPRVASLWSQRQVGQASIFFCFCFWGCFEAWWSSPETIPPLPLLSLDPLSRASHFAFTKRTRLPHQGLPMHVQHGGV